MSMQARVTLVFVLSLLVCIAVLLGTPAFAYRPYPGDTHQQRDVCTNLRGVQPLYLFLGSGAHFRFKVNTPDPSDCYRITD